MGEQIFWASRFSVLTFRAPPVVVVSAVVVPPMARMERVVSPTFPTGKTSPGR